MFLCKGPGGKHFWLCGPDGLHHSHSTPLLQCENSIDNAQMNELGCVPAKLYLRRQMEDQICPIGHSWLDPALHWGQSDLSKRQVESYSLSYLKTSSASPSALSSSQSPVGPAPCQLSHWTLHEVPCMICSSILLAVPRAHGCICLCHIFAHLSPSLEACCPSCHQASGGAAHLHRVNPGALLS